MGLTYKTRPVWTWPANLREAVQIEWIQYDEWFDAPPAEPMRAFAAPLLARRWQISVMARGQDALSLVDFVYAVGGPARGFWFPDPEFFEVRRITGRDVTIAPCGLVEAWAREQPISVCFYSSDQISSFADVISVQRTDTGEEVLTLNADPPAETALTRLYYARLTDIEFTWHAPELLECAITLVELPGEYAGIDAGLAPVWLLAWSDTYLARWPWPLEYDGHIYAPAPFRLKSIRRSLENGEEFTVTGPTRLLCSALGKLVYVRWLLGQQLETIAAAFGDDLTVTGEVAELHCRSWRKNARYPARMYAETCSLRPFGRLCGAQRPSVDCTINAVSGREVTIVCPHPQPALFRHGELVVGETGFRILNLSANGNTWVCLVDRPPALNTPIQGTMLAGCDGSLDTCSAFGNTARWGGFPRCYTNYSLKAQSSYDTGSKK